MLSLRLHSSKLHSAIYSYQNCATWSKHYSFNKMSMFGKNPITNCKTIFPQQLSSKKHVYSHPARHTGLFTSNTSRCLKFRFLSNTTPPPPPSPSWIQLDKYSTCIFFSHSLCNLKRKCCDLSQKNYQPVWHENARIRIFDTEMGSDFDKRLRTEMILYSMKKLF